MSVAASSARSPRELRLKLGIAHRAKTLGFNVVGIGPAGVLARNREGLLAFVAAGWQGEMGWLAREPAKREDPRALWPEAKSAIVVGLNYGPESDPLEGLARREAGVVSVYARNRDYHDVLKGKLKQLAGWLHSTHGAEVKVFVDTAPVMEKPLAERAGVGWQGKHTNLVSRAHGPWLFLGVILTDLDLPADPPETDHCGSCRRCLDVCPTDAFPAPYKLDARRCISYLTIEHKGPIPREFREPMGNRIYGCDDCLSVCPWNKFASVASEAKLRARDELMAPPLAELAALDDAAFRRRFAGSPIKRTGRDRFVRNVLSAIANSAEPALAEEAKRRLADESALVRGMAVWALARLAPADEVRALADRHRPRERDPDVLEEWRQAT